MNNFEIFLARWVQPDPLYEKVLGERKNRRLTAVLRAQETGRLAGVSFAQQAVLSLKVESEWHKKSGEEVRPGEEIARFQGLAEPILKLENLVIGLMSKPSGIASAGGKAIKIAEGKIRLVCGGWKKHPFPIKEIIREAVTAGGLSVRILDQPFFYLDKNYVRIFGGVEATLIALAGNPAEKVIQVRGEFAPIGDEARKAVRNGANVIMVDTGSRQDLHEVLRVMKEEKAFPRVKAAFAGGIRIEDIPALAEKGVDILDIGAAILDAPWLEMNYDIVGENE